MFPPRAPLFCVVNGSAVAGLPAGKAGLPAGKAGLRPRLAQHGQRKPSPLDG